MSIVSNIHNILRWLVLLFALIVLITTIGGLRGTKVFGPSNKRWALLLLICCDIQLLLGLALYFSSNSYAMLKTDPKLVMHTPSLRFFAVEHSVGMLVAILLVHVGYAGIKGARLDAKKFRRLFWCTLMGLVIILAMIPWPARKDGNARPLFPGMPVTAPAADTAAH